MTRCDRTRLYQGILLLLGVAVILVGTATAQGVDEIGVYFDAAYTRTILDTTTFPGVITGYLVLHNPSAAGGVAGWELCASVNGPAEFTNWVLEGQNINTSPPPCFTVGIGANPLPAAPDVLLATFQLVITEPRPVSIHLDPKYNASIPGSMAYVDGGDLNRLVPLATATGSSLVAEINPDLPWYELSATNHNFREVTIGDQSYFPISITNTGGGFLPLDIHFSPPDSAYHFQSPVTIDSLAAGETAYLTVVFAPQAEGLATTHLVFGGIVPDVILSGTGVEPPPRLGVSSTDLFFGDVTVGETVTRAVTVFNTGLKDVTITPSLDDTTGAFAFVAGGDPYFLAAGQNRTVIIGLTPLAAVPYDALLSFHPDAPIVHLRGNGIEPVTSFELDPTALDLGAVAAGYPLDGTVTLTNTGETVLDIDPHLPADPGPFSITGGGGPAQVLPGQTHTVAVSFLSSVAGSFQMTLFMGGIVPTVSLTATAEEPVTGCVATPLNLTFGEVTLGQTGTRYLTVTNTGNIPLELAPSLGSCAYFSVDPDPVALGAYDQVQVPVRFQPLSEGFWTCQLDLGEGLCGQVVVSGTGAPFNGGGDGLAAIYFDPGYQSSLTGTDIPNEIVTAYLVLENSSNTSGVGGWEGRLKLSGDAEFVDFDIQGQYINVETPPSFLVGIGGAPLPWSSHILLAEFRVLVPSPLSTVDITLGPIYRATIPGFSAWVPWDDLEDVRPMQWQEGDVVLARIADSPLGVEAPPPAAMVTAQGVTLVWSLGDGGAEGCHVYRRLGDRPEERLTDQPVLPLGGNFTFIDPAVGLPAGATVRYSYASIHNGREDIRSPEVAVTLSGMPVLRSRLLPNIPNPFNPMTEIRFETTQDGPVRVTIYDVTGRLVRVLVNETMGPGPHSRLWQGRDDAGRPVPSGAYYVRLETPARIDGRKILLLK